ncbi:MAG: type II toxin-antitoxin system VapB family antitoxin [Sphingomonadaceae bacterium]
MGLSIKDPETERLVRALAAQRKTGVTLTIKNAVLVELSTPHHGREDDEWWRALKDIQDRSRALPVLDARSPDEILGYDANGAPA